MPEMRDYAGPDILREKRDMEGSILDSTTSSDFQFNVAHASSVSMPESTWNIARPGSSSGSENSPRPLVEANVTVHDLIKDANYTSIQDAVNNASTNGAVLQINGIAVENIMINGKNITIWNSSFSLYGNINVMNSGSLTIDPSWVNMSGNWYVDAGEVNVTDNTVVQFNCSHDGEFGIQVNASGTMMIQNGSVIRSNGTAAYWFHVLLDAVLNIENSMVRDCGWNETEPGLISFANDTFIHNGTFAHTPAGIVLFGVKGAKIENSTIYDTMMGGIGLIDGSDGNYIANNTIDNGEEGIHMENSSMNLILNNEIGSVFWPQDYGIYIEGGSRNNISWNQISSYSGICMKRTDNNSIYDNDIRFADTEMNLMGYWRMDERRWTGAPDEVMDSSGLGHHGQAFGNAKIDANGKYGNAGHFDGDGDYLEVGDALNAYNGLTMEAWVYIYNSSEEQKIMGNADPEQNVGYVMGVENGQIYAEVWDTSGTNYSLNAGNIPSNQWVHLAVTWKVGGLMVAYVNGNMAGTIPVGSNMIGPSTNDFIVGAAPWDTRAYGVHGLIDEVKLYYRAISYGEIEKTYMNEVAFGIYMRDSPDNSVSYNINSSYMVDGQGYASIYLDNSSPVLEHVMMVSSLYGLISSNASSPLLLSSRIDSTVRNHVLVSGDSHPVLLDTFFNKERARVMDEGGDLTVEWYLDIYVKDSSGAYLAGASVDMTDMNGNYFHVGATDATGHVGPLVLVEYIQNWSDRDHYSPYDVYADDGSQYGSEGVRLDRSGSAYITVNLAYVHNVEQGTDYAGINPAIIDANPGEHLEIYGGTHNETVVVDRALHITGVGTPYPVVNGNRSGPAFLLSAEDVEISGLNITNRGTGVYFGVYAEAGGFNIHDNVFWTQSAAIRVGHSMKNMVGESITWGDVNIQDNEINAAYMGIVMDGSIQNLTGTHVSFGDYNISGNRISSAKAGIYMEMWGSTGLNDGADIDFGRIFMHGNAINASSGRGIYMSWTGAGEYMSGGSRVSLGDTVAIGNRINASSGSGIEIEDESSAYNMSGDSRVVFGSIDMSGNRILSTGDSLAIYLSFTGYEMHDTSSFEMGDISVDSNIVNSTGSNRIAVFMTDMGEYMYNYSTWFGGNANITGNTMLDTGGWGVVAVESIAKNMYGHSSVTSGSINMLENSVRNGKNGMAVVCDESGENMFDNAEFASGGWNIMHNDVNVTNVGLELYSYAFGVLTYGNSVASRGNMSVRYNDVATEVGTAYIVLFQYTGAYIYDSSTVTSGWLDTSHNSFESDTYTVYIAVYFNAAYLEDGSSVHIGNFLFTHNDIYSNESAGIYVEQWDLNGAYNSGNTYAEIGSFIMNDNNISTNFTNGGPGIYIDTLAESGSYLMDFAGASVGDFEFNDNRIRSGDSGIYVDAFGGFGYDLSYDFGNDIPQAASCHVTMGHVEFNGNTIESNVTGIGIDELGYIGSELYGSSTFSMGNFEVMENGINARDAGIVMGDLGGSDGAMEFGYDLHDYSKVTLGDFLFNGNTVNASNYVGIYVNSFSDVAEEMYGYSQFTMGDFEISYNKLSAPGGYGIYLEAVEGLANEMYDHSTAEFGDFRFNWNTVTDADGYGLYSDYIDYFAYEMYNSSTAIFGDFEFNNNSMHSNNSGIEVYCTDFGENMYSSSQAHFGGIQINDNHVNTTGANNSGIDMGDWGGILNIGYGLYGNAYLEVGNIEALRNLINTNLSGDGSGIEVYIDALGNETHGNSVALFHDFLFNDNTIESGGNGIHFSDFSSAGSGMYDYSYVTLGNIEIDRNTIHSEQNGTYFDEFDYFGYYMNDYSTFEMGGLDINNNTIVSMYDGVYFEPALFGAEMHYGARATIGSNHILNNTITASNGDGVYSAWWRGFGYEMYENSYLTVGDASVCGNNISASGNGAVLLFEWTGYEIYDAASADFGNYTASHNTVSSDDGVGLAMVSTFSILELGPYTFSTSNSHVAMGDMTMDYNDVKAPDDAGVILQLYMTGYYITDGSWASMGDMSINNNTVDAKTGIYVYMDGFGENIGGSASVSVGTLNISGNSITADAMDGTGIAISLSDSVYNIQQSASFEMEDIKIFDNTVTESYKGIDIKYDTVGRTQDDVYARIPGVHAHENSIIAHDAGVYIKESDTPCNAGGTQEWGTIEVYNSTVNSRNGTHIESDTTDAKPDIWIHDGYFGRVGSSSIANTGIYDYRGEALFERCTFDGYREGIYARGSNLTVGRSDFRDVTEWDVNMTNAAYVFMVDDNFNKTNVLFQDSDSILDIGWYITVNVVTQTGNGVPYADVTYTSNTSAPTIFNGSFTTDVGGQYVIMLREYRENITGIIEQYNPYNMTGSKAGLTGWMTPTPIDASKDVFIVLTDHEDPLLGTDSSDSAGTTGDPFTFRTGAMDNIGVDFVTVYYRYGSSGAYSSATMQSENGINWAYTMNLASDFVGDMEYYFVATDIAGNTFSGGQSSAPVTDNDAPYGLVDSSPNIITAPSYTFNMSISDNIGVTGTYVVYMFDTDSPVNISLSGSGPYTATIDVTYAESLTLTYYFTARDAAGNWFTGSPTTIYADDSTPPLIGNDTSDTSGTTGDQFTFRVNVTDDFSGVDSVIALYWFGSGERMSINLSASGNTYSGSITIPSNSLHTLHYFFNATDNAGNYNVSGTKDVNISDNDRPSVSDASTGNPAKGSTFILIAITDDNIGVNSTTAEYWFDDGPHEIGDMTGIGDVWILVIDVPESASQLHYVLNATDYAGNYAKTPEITKDVREPVDSEAPQITDTTNSIPISGRDFTFSAVVVDNVEVSGVYVEYWFDNSDPTNISMTYAGSTWEYSMNIPSGASALHYIFHAVDTSNNWAHTEEKDLSVQSTATDNEPPEITDTTAGTPNAGASFVFKALVTDDVEVAGVYVVYWIDEGVRNNVSMGSTGSDWEYRINIPTSASALHYFISARDTSNNWNSTAEKTLNVQSTAADTDAPGIGPISTSGNATEGENFGFTVDVTDNVGVSTVYVVYWTDSNPASRLLLTGEGTYTGTMTVPKGSQLHYYVVAEDTSGNKNQSSMATIPVTSQSGGSGTPLSGGNAPSSGNDILYILVIIVLLVAVAYLAATRKNGPKEERPAEARKEELKQPEQEPEPEEERIIEDEEIEDTGDIGESEEDIGDLITEDEL